MANTITLTRQQINDDVVVVREIVQRSGSEVSRIFCVATEGEVPARTDSHHYDALPPLRDLLSRHDYEFDGKQWPKSDKDLEITFDGRILIGIKEVE